MSTPAAPILVETAFDDPLLVRRLVERNGPYPSIASYLPPSATVTATGEAGVGGPPPWFRANWAVNGRCGVEGADVILDNPRFIDAASRLFGDANVRPTTVVVNVNAAMGPGAIHLDIASFRGANRDRYPCRCSRPWERRACSNGGGSSRPAR